MRAVPAGYKQTEVGVIPKDWKSRTIGDLCVAYSGGTPPTSIRKYYGGDIPWITSSDLNKGYIETVNGRITQSGLENSSAKMVNAGSLLIALYGATAGVTAITRVSGAINQAVLAIIPKTDDTHFIYQYLRFKKDWVINTFTQGGQPNLSGDIVKSLPIPVPEVAEQRAIAATLSDADALLAKLDQLIAKKRDLKQAAMQQLLTSQTRLPGFSGPWSSIRMSKHSSLKARIGWQALTTAEYLGEGDYYLVTGTDFIGGRVNWSSCHYVNQWRYDQDRNIQLRDGDVLLTKDGTIGKVGYVDGLRGPATLNSGVFVIRPLQESFSPLFLFYILRSKVFDEFLAMITAGSTIVHLYQKDFVTFEFLAPSIEEQIAIATVLSDMDAELSALVGRRDKTRALKQGMMQELLTGRIRLV